jgi:hypothetical protein
MSPRNKGIRQDQILVGRPAHRRHLTLKSENVLSVLVGVSKYRQISKLAHRTNLMLPFFRRGSCGGEKASGQQFTAGANFAFIASLRYHSGQFGNRKARERKWHV